MIAPAALAHGQAIIADPLLGALDIRRLRNELLMPAALLAVLVKKLRGAKLRQWADKN